MAKRSGGDALSMIIGIAVWLTGVIVSLSVGFAMVEDKLSLPNVLGGSPLAMIAGWIVVILTLLSVVLAIIEKLK